MTAEVVHLQRPPVRTEGPLPPARGSLLINRARGWLSGGCLCGEQYGMSTIFIEQVTCGSCLVRLDAALEQGGVVEVVRVGLAYVNWLTNP